MESRSSKNKIESILLKPTDVALLKELNEVFADAFDDHETHLSKPPTDRYLKALLSKSHVIVFVARYEQKVVGGLFAYVLEKYEQERSEVYLYDLAVDAHFRRQGIARHLIEALRLRAKEIGAHVIFVQADREDIPAIKLYESLGTPEEPFHFDISVPRKIGS